MTKDEAWMRKALLQAKYALSEDEIPVGAVIVYQDRLIAQAHNQIERLKDPTAHAEMIAITQAANFRQSKWLNKCTLYVTIEPCLMCAGALVLSRIDRVVFGAAEPKTGALGSQVDVNCLNLNHKLKDKSGVLEEECSQMLKEFFWIKRKQKKIAKSSIL